RRAHRAGPGQGRRARNAEVGARRHARRARGGRRARRGDPGRHPPVAGDARPRRAAHRPRRLARAPQRGAARGFRARVSGAPLRGAAADPRRPVPQAGAGAVRHLTAAFEWQSRAAVGRHLRVYLKNWYTSFLPPALEPITLLLAFGLGLGAYMGTGIQWNERRVDYMDYVAPGMLAYATFITAVFQSLFGAFIRMRFQRTWEG